MKPVRLSTVVLAVLAIALFGTLSCTTDDASIPTLTTIVVSAPATTIVLGQTETVTAGGTDQNGAAIAPGTIVWSSTAQAIATVNSSTGLVTAIAPGAATITATSGTTVGQKLITVVSPAPIKINEVESNGGTPGDWAEFYNPTGAAVDLSGWVMKDNDDTHVYTFPAGTTIAAGGYLVADEASFVFGLGAPDAVRLFNPFGIIVDSYSWTTHAATTYGRCPNLTGAFTTTTTSTKGAANDCSAQVRINEVESNGGTPDDWIELYNGGASAADLSGYVLKDNDDTHIFTIAAGTTIAPGAFMAFDVATIFGLGSADAARLYSPAGTLIDSYSWTAHATTTYGRCADGVGDFTTTLASTKGGPNSCTVVGPTAATWPGTDDVHTVDGTSVFGGNLSGLIFEDAVGGSPAVLWGVRNGLGTLYRLILSGGIWTPDPANGWGAGKFLRYMDGTGDPDAEGVTFSGTGSAGGIYVSTERNNSASGVSRLSILRFDPSNAGTVLTATNDWNLTADLPVVGANLGLEGITYVPDAFLVAQGFFDEAAGHTYAPAEYANHGGGIFFVGVEGNGVIYGYALNHVTNTFTRVATISSGFAAVMDLQFDRELNYLWAICDDGCGGQYATLEINTTAGSSTKGRFQITHVFARPASMPNLNNEGFAMAPQSFCAAGFKPVFWSDDTETNGHSIRQASLPCTRFP